MSDKRVSLRKKLMFGAIAVAVAIPALSISAADYFFNQRPNRIGLGDLTVKLTNEIKNFSDSEGRYPASLVEVENYSGLDFSRLEKYSPEFTPNQQRVFYIERDNRANVIEVTRAFMITDVLAYNQLEQNMP